MSDLIDQQPVGAERARLERERRRVLMIAFQFPPFSGSVAVQRTLRFVQYLPSEGWTPIVLSAWPAAFEETSNQFIDQIPDNVVVIRAPSIDAKRHLGFRGRYPAAIARPDRWSSWRYGAVIAGLSAIRKYRPAALWATYPIPTALRIGVALQRMSGVPLVVDFRDPMAQEGYPEDPVLWADYSRIEAEAIRVASFSVFTTPSTVAYYAERYPERKASFKLIRNGYDEVTFKRIEASVDRMAPLVPGRLTLLHSGVVYMPDRDPTGLLSAVAILRRNQVVAPENFSIRFRAPKDDGLILRMAGELGVTDLVEILPEVNYAEAIAEMMRADGLILISAASFDQHVPAKLYEYLRSGPPVIGVTNPASESAALLREVGVPYAASSSNAEEIAALLEDVISSIRSRSAARPNASTVKELSRDRQASLLAETFEQCLHQHYPA